MRAAPRMHNIRSKPENVRKEDEYVRRWTTKVTSQERAFGPRTDL